MLNDQQLELFGRFRRHMGGNELPPATPRLGFIVFSFARFRVLGQTRLIDNDDHRLHIRFSLETKRGTFFHRRHPCLCVLLFSSCTGFVFAGKPVGVFEPLLVSLITYFAILLFMRIHI